MIKTRERDDCLEWLSDFDDVILYADFEHEKVGTNLADSYYDITFAMGEFLEFADRIREKLNEQKGEK